MVGLQRAGAGPGRGLQTAVLERARFCAICSANLDEFFQVRVAGPEGPGRGRGGPSQPGRPLTRSSPGRDSRGSRSAASPGRASLFLGELVPALAAAGIRYAHWDELTASTNESRWWRSSTSGSIRCSPHWRWTPAIPSPTSHRCRSIWRWWSGDPGDATRRFARVKVPPLFPRFKLAAEDTRIVPIEEIVAAHLDLLFPGVELVSWHPFRVTRNADLTLDDEEEADDLLAAVEMELRRRRFKKAVRIEVAPGMPADVRSLLLDELELDAEDLYEVGAPLDLSGLGGLGVARPARPQERRSRSDARASVRRSRDGPGPVRPVGQGRRDGAPPVPLLRRDDGGVHRPGGG